MVTALWIFALLVFAGIMFYHRVNLWIWALSLLAAQSVWVYMDPSRPALQTAAITAWLAVFVPLCVFPIRRRVFSAPAFALFKKVLPSMSSTEKEALEAGTVWWDQELFSGNPHWHKLLDVPLYEHSKEERDFLDGPTEELCEMINDWEITHELRDLPQPVWDYLKKNGFFGMIIPTEYGGLGFSHTAHSDVVVKVASRSISAAVTVMVPNSLGPAELLLRYGTDQQKQYYLPRLARGEEVPCFALTGPEAGSDAAAMPDTGVVCRGEHKGEQVLGIRLNWNKRYITLGPVATVLGLAFKLYDSDHLLGEQTELGITLALIPTDTAGVEIGRRHYPLNAAFQNGPNQGRDVFIPMDWIIGGQERIGQGWSMLMQCLATGRSISLPGLSIATGKLLSRGIGAYARVRRQFNMPIGKFEGIEEPLARIAGYTYLLNATGQLTTTALDLGEQPSVISAIAKYNMTEHMRKIVDDGMDIQGGAAISMGPSNFMARIYQAVPISITVEGANILTRSLIIFGQGAVRCHPYVLTEMQAARDEDPKRGLRTFDAALFGHIGFSLSNIVRSLFLGISSARLVFTGTSGPARRHLQQLTRWSAAFAMSADLAMLSMGGNLKRREKLSGRLADVLSHLYMASAVIHRFERQGRQEEDRVLLDWCCEESLYIIQLRLEELLRNFPVRPLAWVMRRLIFPFGRHGRAPNDRLGQLAAQCILAPSGCRDRLTTGIYLPDSLSEPLGRLDDALIKTVRAEPIEKRLRKAQKSGQLASDIELREQLELACTLDIITEQEADWVDMANQARLAVIQVDDFDANLDLQTSEPEQPVAPPSRQQAG